MGFVVDSQDLLWRGTARLEAPEMASIPLKRCRDGYESIAVLGVARGCMVGTVSGVFDDNERRNRGIRAHGAQ